MDSSSQNDQRSPPAMGATLLQKDVHPDTYPTRSPFAIDQDTYLVAVVGGNLDSNSPSQDGWFTSDFYAFNYLFKGLGRKQAWIAGAKPQSLVHRYGNFLHGNPGGQRKVVLSSELLDSDELTEVQVEPSNSLGERFVEKVREYADLAYKDDAKLLLIMLCHGSESGVLQLGRGFGHLTYTKLRGCIDMRVQTTIISTACYSGVWLVNSGFNYTTMMAAGPGTQSLSWKVSKSMSRACGSIFASAVIESLAAHSSDKAPGGDDEEEKPWGWRYDPCPRSATDLQTATFNEFCRTVNDLCGVLIEGQHEFSFTAQDDEWSMAWTNRTGISYRYFKERWDALTTHVPVLDTDTCPSPVDAQSRTGNSSITTSSTALTTHLSRSHESSWDVAHLRSCIDYFLTTNPGSWQWGAQVGLRGFLTKCRTDGSPWREYLDEDADDMPPVEEQLNAFAVIQYRVQFAMAVDYIVANMGLPLPDGKKALLFDLAQWQADNLSGSTEAEKQRLSREWFSFPARKRFVHEQFLGFRTLRQGPQFHVMAEYMCALMYEFYKTTGSLDETNEKIDEFLRQFEGMKDCMLEVAKADASVETSKKRWLGSIGKA